jgi:hypothetical protein
MLRKKHEREAAELAAKHAAEEAAHAAEEKK